MTELKADGLRNKNKSQVNQALLYSPLEDVPQLQGNRETPPNRGSLCVSPSRARSEQNPDVCLGRGRHCPESVKRIKSLWAAGRLLKMVNKPPASRA